MGLLRTKKECRECQDAEKWSVRSVWSVSSIWSDSTIWLNQTNQIDQMNQPRFLESVMSEWNVPNLIDHTVLRPDATKMDVLRLCQEAKEFGFSVIFVPPCYVDEAVAAVAGTAILVGIPIGFPLGGHTTKAKVAEAVEAVARGARVLDMVMNVSRLKSGDREYVRQDIAEVVKATTGV